MYDIAIWSVVLLVKTCIKTLQKPQSTYYLVLHTYLAIRLVFCSAAHGAHAYLKTERSHSQAIA